MTSLQTVQRISDIDPTGAMRILIFTEPGGGKTALAGTFPQPLFIDTDRGMKTIASKWYREWSGFDEGRLGQIGFRTFDDEYDPRTGLFKSAKAFFEAIAFVNQEAKSDEWRTIVFDSISTLQILAMHVGLELSAQRGSVSKALATARTQGNLPVAVPTQADYGSEMAAFEQFMNGAQHVAFGLQKHLVMLAHVRETTGASGGILTKEPYLIGSSIRAQVAKWFDEVWYLETAGNGERRLITQAKGALKILKTRHGVPSGIVDPTFDKIMEAIP